LKSLALNYKKIFFKISKADNLLFFLDYDGTLAPIALKPELALMSNSTRKALKKLMQDKRVSVSVISGRTLKDVKRLVAIKGIYYSGCHGLETENLYSAGSVSDLKKIRIFIKQARKSLVKELSGIVPTGIIDIEDKGFILSLHYRRVKKQHIKYIKKVFYGAARQYVDSGEMIVTRNKKVLELRPDIKWDKGTYCLYMLKILSRYRKKILPIYIGDDRTDETAFKALKGKGITIFVKGERKTSLAQYYVNSTSEVRVFLQMAAKNMKSTA
jgi:trehalose 6-phosphate phosphatase